MIERVDPRPVAPDEASDLPGKQRGESEQKQYAGPFADGDGTNEKSGHRNRDQRQQDEGRAIDAAVRPPASIALLPASARRACNSVMKTR